MLKAGTHPKIVQERLGHSSIAMTLDTYSHVAPGLQEAAAGISIIWLILSVKIGLLKKLVSYPLALLQIQVANSENLASTMAVVLVVVPKVGLEPTRRLLSNSF
jgi:hypothetical protein